MRISTAAGIGSGASLLASIAVPIAYPHIEPWVGQYLLVAAALLFALATGLWWPRRHSDDGSGMTQTTHGPQSPIFRDVHGNVTINPAPAEKQERKSPYGGWDNRSLEGLGRVMRGAIDKRSAAQLLADRIARERRERCPPMPVWRALEKIASRIEDHGEGVPEARRQLRQAAAEGRLDIWGQQDFPPAHMQDNRRKQVWTPIEPEYWRDYEINVLATSEEREDSWHTEDEELPGRRGNRYWSLKVSPDDIDQRWPTPSPSPPKPDLPLNGLLVRVYKKLGPPPEAVAAKAAFYRKIDFEIGDHIAENDLHVWGRYFDRPRELISARSLKKGRFDHRKRVFRAPTIDSGPMEYMDLHFNKAEVDRIWPTK